MLSRLDLFCSVDDFWQQFAPSYQAHLLSDDKRHRQRVKTLAPSEIMTILMLFHQSQYRTFKAFYTEHVAVHLRQEFPHLVSYPHFIQWQP